MFWVISFDFCIGRAPHRSHAGSCVLRGVFMCVRCSVMLVKYCCFAGGIFSFVAYGDVSVPPCGGIRLRARLVSVCGVLVAGFCDL